MRATQNAIPMSPAAARYCFGTNQYPRLMATSAENYMITGAALRDECSMFTTTIAMDGAP